MKELAHLLLINFEDQEVCSNKICIILSYTNTLYFVIIRVTLSYLGFQIKWKFLSSKENGQSTIGKLINLF